MKVIMVSARNYHILFCDLLVDVRVCVVHSKIVPKKNQDYRSFLVRHFSLGGYIPITNMYSRMYVVYAESVPN